MAAVVLRRRFRVRGVVQGVGFPPFVHGLATRRGLGGFVLNDGEGVVVEVEGDDATLDEFADALRAEAPGLAHVDQVVAEALAPSGDRAFRIVESRPTGRAALIPPDVATCDDCLRELFDPADRRYRYPFLNCTQCGPRFTIVRDVPYDRARTTMVGFGSSPTAGGSTRIRPTAASTPSRPAAGVRASALAVARGGRRASRAGKIVAVKGIGGYHLACDAGDEEAVARLRARKTGRKSRSRC